MSKTTPACCVMETRWIIIIWDMNAAMKTAGQLIHRQPWTCIFSLCCNLLYEKKKKEKNREKCATSTANVIRKCWRGGWRAARLPLCPSPVCWRPETKVLLCLQHLSSRWQHSSQPTVLNGLFMGLSCDRMTCGTLAPQWLLANQIRNMPPSLSDLKRATSPNYRRDSQLCFSVAVWATRDAIKT